MVKLLVEKGADVNLRSSWERDALYYAIREKNEEMARYLVDNGAEVNRKTKGGKILDTPLCASVCAGMTEFAKFLVDKGADINDVNIAGNSALMCAINYDRMELIEFFIGKNCDLDIKNNRGLNVFDLANGGYSPKGNVYDERKDKK